MEQLEPHATYFKYATLPLVLGEWQGVQVEMDVGPPATKVERPAELALERRVRRRGGDQQRALEVLLAKYVAP